MGIKSSFADDSDLPIDCSIFWASLVIFARESSWGTVLFLAKYVARATSSFAKPYIIALVVRRLPYNSLNTRFALQDTLLPETSLDEEEDSLRDFSSLHLSDVH
ncbi:hypothetical protein NPIL_519441 [Nephila pilipes]|uniref:Uncharacterized protein n=1 Tax=Nephila pilipes TaxID=299642 RepID=A0A8X6TI14_NEPPI|nr:hypothetical protein NPIL_519441 [Nephila pilipes]